MAHEIYESDAMVYRKEGGTPWHKIGVDVPDNLTATEGMMIKNADGVSLDWELDKVALLNPHTLRPFKDQEDKGHFMMLRSDNGQIVGNTCTEGYEIFQNREQAKLCDSLVETGAFRLETCGSLKGGRIVWFLGKIKSAEIIPGDFVDCYVLCYTAHDGSSAFRMFPTIVRVVCANTAAAAIRGGKGKGMSIRHTKNMRGRIEQAKEQLRWGFSNVDQTVETYKKLSTIQITSKQAQDFAKFVACYGGVKDEEATRVKNKIENITHKIYAGKGQSGEIRNVRGTAWAAFNGMTEYLNYDKPAKGGSDIARMENRLNGIVNGASKNVIAAGTQHLLALA